MISRTQNAFRSSLLPNETFLFVCPFRARQVQEQRVNDVLDVSSKAYFTKKITQLRTKPILTSNFPGVYQTNENQLFRKLTTVQIFVVFGYLFYAIRLWTTCTNSFCFTCSVSLLCARQVISRKTKKKHFCLQPEQSVNVHLF